MKKIVLFLFSISLAFVLGVTLASNGMISLTLHEEETAGTYREKAQKHYAGLLEDLKKDFDQAQNQISDDQDKRSFKVSLARLEKKVSRLEDIHPQKWKELLKNIDQEANELKKKLKEQI